MKRQAEGKRGTGRKRTEKELQESLQEYQKFLEPKVKISLPWEDYLELIDISEHLRPINGIDMAFRLGYLYGTGELQVK